jgi:hypothetical protein
MEMDPQSSQNDHIVLRPLAPAAQAIRSFGIWEQLVLYIYQYKMINATIIDESNSGQHDSRQCLSVVGQRLTRDE